MQYTIAITTPVCTCTVLFDTMKGAMKTYSSTQQQNKSSMSSYSVMKSIAMLVSICLGLSTYFGLHKYTTVLSQQAETPQFVRKLFNNNTLLSFPQDDLFPGGRRYDADYKLDTETSIDPQNHEQQQQQQLTYYVPARGVRDRAGAAIFDMLKAQAYSFSKNIKYGGACGHTPHREQNENMIRILGLETLLVYNCPPPANTTGPNERHEIITREVFFDQAHTYFTDEWLDYIHNYIQPTSQMWQQQEQRQQFTATNDDTNQNRTNSIKNNYTIAMHIRRGDIDPCGKWSFRYLPNIHYLGLLNLYTQQAPANQNVQCIVFSESHSLVENFDDFYKQKCQVILDGDPTLAWKTMLDANVVVLSASSFSMVPALLNRNTNAIIAYTPHGNQPLRPDWKWHEYKHRNQMWRTLIRLCDNPPTRNQ